MICESKKRYLNQSDVVITDLKKTVENLKGIKIFMICLVSPLKKSTDNFQGMLGDTKWLFLAIPATERNKVVYLLKIKKNIQPPNLYL